MLDMLIQWWFLYAESQFPDLHTTIAKPMDH